MTRMDWAIELWNWFEYYLKGVGEEPEAMFRFKPTMESGMSKKLGHLKT